MTVEENTFNKLRRLPVPEMLVLLNEIKMPPPMFQISNVVYERSKFYNDISYHYEKVKLLERHGWGLEEFVLEIEKRIILEQVRLFNEDKKFPSEIIERAKRFFPNAKFTEASIELE